MIRGNSIIRILDIDTGEHLASPVSSIVSKYASNIRNVKNGIEVDFHNVKIQNWFGWSDLESIQKIYEPDVTWFDVIYRKHPEMKITLSDNERLMVYDPERRMPTPNGGSKYSMRLITVKNAYTIGQETPIILRSRYANDTIDSVDHFNAAIIRPTENQQALSGNNGGYFGYIVRTSSGAYNADSLHVNGLTDDDLESIASRHANFEFFF